MIAEWLMKVISNMVISHALSLLLLVCFDFYIVLHAERTPLFRSYIMLTAGPFFWLFGKIIKIVAPDLWLRWTGIIMQYLGVGIIGPAFFIFCYIFMTGKKIPGAGALWISLPSAILFLLIAFNPLHHLFYLTFTLYRDSFGPVFYANQYLIYAFLAAGGVFLAWGMITKDLKHKKQILLFILAAAVPLAASFYYPQLGGRFTGLRFDITPIAFNITFLFFGIAAFRYDFLGIPSIAHAQVLAEMPEGIVVRDEKGGLLYANRMGKGKAALLSGNTGRSGLSHRGRRYNLKSDSLQSSRHKEGLTVCRLLDVTNLTEKREEIQKRTTRLKELTREIKLKISQEEETLYTQERARAAQELHDILGHSLTLLISQMEATRLDPSPKSQKTRMKRMKAILKEGREDLKRSLAAEGNREGERDFLLSRQLQELIERAGTDGKEIELAVQGEEQPVPSETARNVHAVVREAVTNSFRHGKADHIAVILSFKECLKVLIMDNGLGCSTIREGNGLTGMRNRAKKLGGSLAFSSHPGEGFSIILDSKQEIKVH